MPALVALRCEDRKKKTWWSLCSNDSSCYGTLLSMETRKFSVFATVIKVSVDEAEKPHYQDHLDH